MAFTVSGSCLKGQLDNSNRANLSKFSKRFVCRINVSLNFKGKMCPNIPKRLPEFLRQTKRVGKRIELSIHFSSMLAGKDQVLQSQSCSSLQSVQSSLLTRGPKGPTQRAKALAANSKAQMFNFQLLPS